MWIAYSAVRAAVCSAAGGVRKAQQETNTKKTRTKPTKIINDGKVEGYEPDTEHYVEMDEE
jgi:hypothetical protein